jgi:hypothetical protein
MNTTIVLAVIALVLAVAGVVFDSRLVALAVVLLAVIHLL